VVELVGLHEQLFNFKFFRVLPVALKRQSQEFYKSLVKESLLVHEQSSAVLLAEQTLVAGRSCVAAAQHWH